MKEEIKEFLIACKEAAEEIRKREIKSPLYIFSHFDPDGLTAASILAIAFKREKIPFQVKILKRLEIKQLNVIGAY